MTTADERFGREVQRRREQKGWSMTRFASLLTEAGVDNFHSTTVGRIERGERPVRLSEAVAVAQVLDVPLESLIPTDAQTLTDAERAVRLYSETKRAIRVLARLLADRLAGLPAVREDLVEVLESGDLDEAGIKQARKWLGIVDMNLAEGWRLPTEQEVRDMTPVQMGRARASVLWMGDDLWQAEA
ncbi:helix-turn-helix domain-containing protein [Arsenicicoccus cauae]|nr:helix-turn-helix transcriptional regulator [Arsenicicoccus cauae]